MKTLVTLLVIASSFAASAATIQFDLLGKGGAGLLSTNENGGIAGNPGSGGEIGAGITFDTVTKTLFINVAWGVSNGFTNLTTNATGSHIHGPALFTANGPVVISLTRANSTSDAGFISTTTRALTPTEETALFDGLYYINIHTSINGGGEIRGNMVPAVVPEPSTALMGVLGALAVFRRRRR